MTRRVLSDYVVFDAMARLHAAAGHVPAEPVGFTAEGAVLRLRLQAAALALVVPVSTASVTPMADKLAARS